MGDEMANMQARPDVIAALAEPAFASLARAGAPLVVASGDPARVIFANAAALALFGVADCASLTRRIFVSDDSGALRLAQLSRSIMPGAAARLERLMFTFGAAPESMTLLCRRTLGAPTLFVFAGIGLRAGQGRRFVEAEAQASGGQVFDAHASASDESAMAGQGGFAQSASPQAASRLAAPLPASPLAKLRNALAARYPGLPPTRFLWKTDAANVVTQITPPLAEIVGEGLADLLGRDLAASANKLGLDLSGDLGQALRDRATFSGVEVLWPIENVAAAVPVALGGLPSFDASRQFEGWRGFGVIHLARLCEAPLFVAQPEAPAAETRLQVTAQEVGAPQEIKSELTESEEAGPVEKSRGVVVPLRPNHGLRAGNPGADASKALERDFDLTVALSPHERKAFREIARSLGARGADIEASADLEMPADLELSVELEPEAVLALPVELSFDVEEAAAHHPEPEPSPAGGAVVAELFEHLPFGLIVSRDGAALFANRLLLDWLGFADLAALNAAGGLRAVFRAETPGAQRRPFFVRPLVGLAFSADAQCVNVDWDGAPAQLYSLTRPSAGALEQRIGVLEGGLRQRETETGETLAILDTAADGVVILNGDGAILGLNRAAETLFGYDRNDVAGESFTSLLARESHAAALDYFSRLKAGGVFTGAQDGRQVVGCSRQGGAVTLFMTLGRVGLAANGKFCAVLRDMTGWTKAEGEMVEARAEAERASQAKSAFLAKISHEIRTPLNAILGFTEVIMEERFGPVGNERYKDYLKDIHASGAHVLSLVNDLLDLSKIEAGRVDLDFTLVDANRIVSECVSLMQPQANRERIITRLSLAPRLPFVLADERSLRQIVLNLLSNAVRYNEPGGQVIVSTAVNDAGHAVVRVKDTGIGMSESELLTAMEPFRQVATGRSAGGTGLGLPLTKALVEANHASFVIKSRKQEGTLVEIAFPVAEAPLVEGQASAVSKA